MKRISIVFAAVVAALAMTAFIGAASASADSVVLCEEDVRPCAAEDVLPAGTPLFFASQWNYEGEGLTLKTQSLTFGCDGMSLGGTSTVKSNPWNTLPMEGQGRIWDCQLNGNGTCSVRKVDSVPASLEWWGSPFIKFGTSSKPFKVTFECASNGKNIKCTFANTSGFPLMMILTYNSGAKHWESEIEPEPLVAQKESDAGMCPSGTAATVEADAPIQVHPNVFPSWTL